jgi:hypothetical protein
MQTHQVQPTLGPPRIATTHELMLPYAADLLRRRAKGASHGQMLAWLHTQGVMVNMGEIASFWPYLATQKQKPHQPAQPPTPLASSNPVGRSCRSAVSADPAQAEPSASVPCRAELLAQAEANNNTGDAEKPNQPSEEKCLPTASGGLTASTEYDISEVMADYKILVARQVAEDKAAPEPDPERRKVTERMVRTLMMYKHSLELREERLAALKIKKADHDRKLSKATKATTTQEAAKETVADRKPPKDFDNTALSQQIPRAESPVAQPTQQPGHGTGSAVPIIGPIIGKNPPGQPTQQLGDLLRNASDGLTAVPYAPSPDDPWSPDNPS